MIRDMGWVRVWCWSLVIGSDMGVLREGRADEGPTFANRIASIVYSKCTPCHREGQSGPFPLTNYAEVSRHASTIEGVLEAGYMPPWKPVDQGFSFANDRRLTEAERKAFRDWLAAECPEGERKEIPSMPKYPDGWSLGEPDLVLKMGKAFEVPASGPDLYRTFVFEANLPEDKWIKAMELRPTARGAVHHALFFVDVDRSVRLTREKDGKPGVSGMNFFRGAAGSANSLTRITDGLARGLGGYVPGTTPNFLPGDLARYLPKGSDILMQTHFHPTGKVEVEQAELAIYFTEREPSHRLLPLQMPAVFGIGAGIDVPAGERDFRIQESYTLPIGVRAFEVGGHAHYICREMEMVATLPGGERKTLLKIADWDLDWQDQYLYAEPIDLPKGTVLDVMIAYDNSKENPENPYSPPQRIRWGRESNDEMGSITLTVVAAEESERQVLEESLRARSRSALRARIADQSSGLGMAGLGGNGGILRLLDRNRDGRLEKAEIPERVRDRLLDLVDRDGDEQLDAGELDAFRKQIQELMDR